MQHSHPRKLLGCIDEISLVIDNQIRLPITWRRLVLEFSYEGVPLPQLCCKPKLALQCQQGYQNIIGIRFLDIFSHILHD